MFEKVTNHFKKNKEENFEGLEIFDSGIDHDPDRNFTIEIIEKENEISLRLTHQSGDTYDLDNVLPDGDCSFIQAEENNGIFSHTYYPKENSSRIEIQTDQVNRRDFLLNVFHEIGHAQQSQNPSSPIGQTHIQQGRLKDSITHLTNNNLTPEEQKAFRKLDYVLSDQTMILERNAWAWALTELRYFEEQGYDVLQWFWKRETYR